MELSNSEKALSNLDETIELQDFISVANRVENSIINCKDIEKKNDNEIVDSIVITNPRNQEVDAS